MSIQFVCAKCAQMLTLPDHLVGMNYSCPRCGTLQQVGQGGAQPVVKAPRTAAAPSLNSPQHVTQSGWYALINDVQYGPYSTAEVCSYIGAAKIEPDTPVWREGLSAWVPVSQCGEFSGALAAVQAADDEEDYGSAEAYVPVQSTPTSYSYSRVKRKKQDHSLYIGAFFLIAVAGALLIWVANRPIDQPTNAVRSPRSRTSYQVINVQRPPRHTVRPPRQVQPQPAPARKENPKDEFEDDGQTDDGYGSDLFGDDGAVSFTEVNEASVKDLPDFKLRMGGQSVRIAKLWTAYRTLIGQYEKAAVALRSAEERMQYVTETRKLAAQSGAERKGKYAEEYKKLDKQCREVQEKAQHEYEIARSRYEDARDAVKRGGSKLVSTVAKQRFEQAAKARARVKYYDPRTKKKWADLLAELKAKYADKPTDDHATKTEDLSNLGDLIRARNALRDSVADLTEKVEKFNAAFEPNLIQLLAAGILRIKCNYKVHGDKVEISGGRWVLVKPGSSEYDRVVRQEIIRIVNRSEEEKRKGRLDDSRKIFALIAERFPGSKLPEDEEEQVKQTFTP